MINNFAYKCYCAGILCATGIVGNSPEEIKGLKEKLSSALRRKEIHMNFGSGQMMAATELCVDFYPMEKSEQSLGFSIKI